MFKKDRKHQNPTQRVGLTGKLFSLSLNPLGNGTALTTLLLPFPACQFFPGDFSYTSVRARLLAKHLAPSHCYNVIKKRRTRQRILTDLYGAFPLLATLVSRLDWNQPLCWSLPSKTRSEGNRSPSRLSTTPDQDEPAQKNVTCFPPLIVSLTFERAPPFVAYPRCSFSFSVWFCLVGVFNARMRSSATISR